MDEFDNKLYWKKAIRQILGQEESVEDNNSCFRESNRSPNSAADLRIEEQEFQENITSNSFLFKSTSSNDKFSEVSGYKSPTFHELTVEKKVVHEFNLNKVQDASSNQQKCSLSERDKNIKVPEWNKAFKSILGKNSNVPASRNQKITYDAIKKHENIQKHDTLGNTRSTSRKEFYKVPVSKESPEEKKVRELFALSQMFKLDYHNNLNEFDGAGVDIFKYDKKSFSKSFAKPASKTEFTDKVQEHESDIKSFIPLKGFVAKFKPYTTADLVASSNVPITEVPWDDELI